MKFQAPNYKMPLTPVFCNLGFVFWNLFLLITLVNLLNIKNFPLFMWYIIIIKALYFFLPAYFANMAPVLFKWLPGGIPIYEKWFGKNKTWRGLVMAVLLGGFIFYLQQLAYNYGFVQWALIDYSDFSLVLGFLLGAGAILGDLVESYYKRKAGLKPGERWLFWDQLDFVFGGILLSFFVYVPPVEVVGILLIASPLLHIVVNHLAYYLRIRKEKW